MAHDPDKFTVVLLGSNPQRKRDVGLIILKCHVGTDDQCRKEENENCVIVNIPGERNINEFLNNKDLSSPDPHAFLLVLERGEKVKEKLARWEKHFPNMHVFTIFIMDRDTIGNGNDMTARCLDIRDQRLGESCERVWKQSIGRRYCIDSGKERGGTVPPPLTVCLLGGTGSGKSASGNTILGSKQFLSEISGAPVTTQCQLASALIDGRELRVIDTPDFFDEDLQQQSSHISECRQMCDVHMCVYLLVIQIGRFIEEERDILENLEKALESKIRDRTIILFTRGDDLGSQRIKDYVRNTNPHLQQIIKDCGGRYHVFNNKYQGGEQVKEQVKELMGKITKLVQDTTLKKDTCCVC